MKPFSFKYGLFIILAACAGLSACTPNDDPPPTSGPITETKASCSFSFQGQGYGFEGNGSATISNDDMPLLTNSGLDTFNFDLLSFSIGRVETGSLLPSEVFSGSILNYSGPGTYPLLDAGSVAEGGVFTLLYTDYESSDSLYAIGYFYSPSSPQQGSITITRDDSQLLEATFSLPSADTFGETGLMEGAFSIEVD